MKKDTLLKKIKDLSDLDKHQEIIDMIEGLPTEQLNNEIIGQLARAYINVQNYEKAIEVLKSIEKEEKNTMLWNYRMGCSYFYLEDYEKAEEYFLKAYNLEPEDENIKDFLMDIYINLSKQVKFGEDDLDNQKKALNYALKAKDYMTTDDKKIECYSYLAFLYNKFTDYHTAENLLKRAISLGRDDLWIHSELGYCLGELNKLEESLEHYLKVIELEPDNIWALSQIVRYNSQIGFCYRLLGKYEEAIENLKKVLEIINGDKKNDNTDEKIFLNSQIGWIYGRIENDEKLKKELEELKEMVNMLYHPS